jgi:UDP-N-acetylglucosamine:LPS N-acetylglucosamine transferase
MKALFVINGLGLGNSTRCHSVIQQLQNRGVDVKIATSGNGIWYFRDRMDVSNITELCSLHYGSAKGKISIGRTLLSVPAMLKVLRDNAALLRSVLDREKPDVVVTDSEYSFIPMKRKGIPIIALNNSDVVVDSYTRFSPLPRSVRAQYHAVEKSDFMYHRRIPDSVISPCLEPEREGIHPKFSRVGPVVRSECLQLAENAPSGRVVIMLSGSVFGSPVRLRRSDYPFEIDILGRDAPENYEKQSGITYHSRVAESWKFLATADLVVINGGFSAVSEAFAMRKPMVVIPVPRHAEQWVNGETIRRLGVGMVADEENLEEALNVAVGKIDDFRSGYDRLPPIPDGAAQAADEIVSFVAARR